ncbi:hypothetical protein FQA39_LY10501 [Lamprigera yunnana]|nr:hypothetical protein FQA39_LY10501 [Lamprigera yunnana]
MKTPSPSCTEDQDYPETKDWMAFVHNYQYIYSNGRNSRQIHNDAGYYPRAARITESEYQQKRAARTRTTTAGRKLHRSYSNAVKHTNRQTNGQKREILRQTYKVSVTSKDPSVTPAEIKTSVQRGVNPTEAGATVRELESVYHGEERCSTWRKYGAGAAEDDRPEAAEDDDGFYGAAVEGEPGANGKHRRDCPEG